MKEVTVKRNLKYILKGFVVSVFLIFIILWSGALFVYQEGASNLIMISVFSLLGIYVLATALFYLVRLVQNKPALMINDSGIIDNTDICALGIIPWRDISIIEYSGPADEKIIKNMGKVNKVVMLAPIAFKGLKAVGRIINLRKTMAQKAYILIEVNDMKKLIKKLPPLQRIICYLFLRRRSVAPIAMDFMKIDINSLSKSLKYYENKHDFELYL